MFVSNILRSYLTTFLMSLFIHIYSFAEQMSESILTTCTTSTAYVSLLNLDLYKSFGVISVVHLTTHFEIYSSTFD